MRCLLFTAFLAVLSLSRAIDSEERNSYNSYTEDSYSYNQGKSESQWKTFDALYDLFKPVMRWFRDELPKKTPQDIATDIKETAVDAKNWAQDSKIIQGVRKTFEPATNWFQDKATSLSGKTFKDIYGDAKESVGNVDNIVGTWIDQNVG